jgi:endoglycosylceramidase
MCVLLAGACSSSEAPRSEPLWSDGTHLRDADGRVAILRGINARVDGVFDVSFADGRVALEPLPVLTSDDCRRMRELGFDLLRLPINWSGVEPRDGEIDDGYLSRVDAAVQCAAGAGMVTLIDLHQDAYSKEIGEDGAPLWAISPPPTMLREGPLTDLGDRRSSLQVTAAFQTFFGSGDPSGLQARFHTMLAHVAAHFADDPGVVGFELFNEPVARDDDVIAFEVAAAEAVHRAAPRKLIFFEPSAVRNFIDFAPQSLTPFPVPGAVYSPHVYTFVFSLDPTRFERATPADLEPSVAGARLEARAWGTPLLIGEFGVGPSTDPQNELWMQTQAQLHDRYFASDAFWLWKERSQGFWGVFEHGEASDTWTERPQVVAWVSRVHIARVAGTPTVVESTPLGDAIHVEIAPGSRTAAPHLIYVPERFAARTRAHCDGAEVATARDPATGLISITCGGTVDVGP